MNTANDFVGVLLTSHIITLAITHFNMQNMDSYPTNDDLQGVDFATKSSSISTKQFRRC